MNANLFGFADWIFKPVLDAIEKGILKAIWSVFITGPLHIVSAFDAVLKFLSSGVVYNLLFNSDTSFDINNIPAEFWQFTIVSIVLLIFIYISQFVAWQFKDPGELKSKLVSCLRYTVLAGLFIFAIPVGFFIVNGLVNWFIGMLNHIFGVQSSNLSDTLYWVGSYSGVGGKPSNYNAPDNIQNWSMILQIFGTWFVMIAVLFLGMALTQKTFELFFLFLISPFVMVGMVQDEGKRALTWKDMVLSRMIAASVTLVSYYIYMFFITIIARENFMPADWNWKTQMLLRLLFLLGGAIAVWGITTLISAFIGEGVGAMEGLQSLRSTLAAGMFTAGAAKIAGRAIGFGKSRRAAKLRNKVGFNSLNNELSRSSMFDQENVNGDNNEAKSVFDSKWGQRSGVLGLSAVATGLMAKGAVGSIWAIRNTSRDIADISKNTASKFKNKYIGKTVGALSATAAAATSVLWRPIKTKILPGAKSLGAQLKEQTLGISKSKWLKEKENSEKTRINRENLRLIKANNRLRRNTSNLNALAITYQKPKLEANPYKILGVKSGAKAEEIKSAYRKLAKQYHPDRNKSPDASKQYQEVNEAYQKLMNSKKKVKVHSSGKTK